MSSFHVHLTIGHNASMPHLPGSLDPQMRVFWQRNRDPFDSSLSLTDLLRAARNVLGAARSGQSWGRRFFGAPPSPQPNATKTKGPEPNPEREKPGGEEPEPAHAEAEQASRRPETARPPEPDPPTEERVRRTREGGRRTTAEAQERLRRAPKEERSRKRSATAEGAYPYGLHLALELSVDRSRGRQADGKTAESPSEREASNGGLPISFRGTVSLHLPLVRPSAGRRGREGR